MLGDLLYGGCLVGAVVGLDLSKTGPLVGFHHSRVAPASSMKIAHSLSAADLVEIFGGVCNGVSSLYGSANGSKVGTPSCSKSRTLRVTTVSPLTTATAATSASSIRFRDCRCMSLAHSRKAGASTGKIL